MLCRQKGDTSKPESYPEYTPCDIPCMNRVATVHSIHTACVTFALFKHDRTVMKHGTCEHMKLDLLEAMVRCTKSLLRFSGFEISPQHKPFSNYTFQNHDLFVD